MGTPYRPGGPVGRPVAPPRVWGTGTAPMGLPPIPPPTRRWSRWVPRTWQDAACAAATVLLLTLAVISAGVGYALTSYLLGW